MKNKTIIILIFCLVLFNSSKQPNNAIDEDVKMLIFTSVINDGHGASLTTFDKWVDLRKNNFNLLEIETTSNKTFYKPNISDSIKGKYEIQVYKVPDNNSQLQSRYLIRYKDFGNQVWLRAAGYVENDMNLLFNYLQQQKIKKSEIKVIIQEWNKSDQLIKELNLEEIFKGYINNNTDSKCFISAYYIRINDCSIGFEPLKEHELNSVFSRLPVYGHFMHNY